MTAGIPSPGISEKNQLARRNREPRSAFSRGAHFRPSSGREVRLVDQFSTPEITLLGEQDGPAELRLKEALGVLLRLNQNVTRAYLLRDGKTGAVTLGVQTDDEKKDAKLVEQVDKALAALFNTTARLDIIFLSENKDAEIRKALPPFYNRYAAWQA
jgi:hypothetical protein